MGKQEDVFLNGEGDAWLDRNRTKIIKNANSDPVIELIKQERIKPKSVLEVGCSNGWRLIRLQRLFNCSIQGIEPSGKAADEADELYGKNFIYPGSAINIEEFMRDKFDLIIFGFCLYLVDPEDLFLVAAYADHILEDGGQIIIHDFCPDIPTKRSYHHKEGVFSYKYDHSKIFTGTPFYTIRHRKKLDDGVAITILQKRGMEVFLDEEKTT